MTEKQLRRLILGTLPDPCIAAAQNGTASLYLINMGSACRVRLMMPIERSVDVSTCREIARREERTETIIAAGVASEIAQVSGRGRSDAINAFGSENSATGIRFVYGPEWQGVVELTMRVFSADDPADEPGVPRRYRLNAGGAGRRTRLPVLGRVGIIHRPSAPSYADESDLFLYWRWLDMPLDEIAWRAGCAPDRVRRIIGAAALKRAGGLARPSPVQSMRAFALLDARRRHEPIDLEVEASRAGLTAEALQRCLDLSNRLDLEPAG